jgi:phosphohistidine phosphatase SixA
MAAALGFADLVETDAGLVPDSDPREAATLVRAHAAGCARLLVVSHLPLVGLLANDLTGDSPRFTPGTWVEMTLAHEGHARLLRRLAPREDV